jgi:hypothetical protein
MWRCTGIDNAVRGLPEINPAATMADAIRGTDLVYVLTEWKSFATPTPTHWANSSTIGESSMVVTVLTG